jgi:hypothetical protein
MSALALTAGIAARHFHTELTGASIAICGRRNGRL